MLVSVGFLNTVLCLLLIRLKWKNGSPFFVFFAIILSLVVFPVFFEEIGSVKYYHNFASPIVLDFWAIVESQVIVAMFLIGFILLEILFPNSQITRALNTNSSSNLPVFLFLIPVLNLAIVSTSYYLFGDLLRFANFLEIREPGPLRNINLTVSYLTLFTAPLPALFLYHSRKVLAVLSLFSLLIPIIFFGAARQPLAISLISLFFLVFQNRKHGDLYFAISAVALLPAAEIVLEAMRLVRNLPDFESRLLALTDISFLKLAIDSPGRDSSVRYVFYQIVEGVDIARGGEFQYLLRTYLFWLPGFLDIFGIKPSDFEADMFRGVMGGRDGTMHPTVFGSIFADAGWYFAPWIATVFVYMRVFEKFMRRHNLFAGLLFFFSFYPSVMMARGSLYAPIVVTFLAFLLIFAGSVLTKSKA